MVATAFVALTVKACGDAGLAFFDRADFLYNAETIAYLLDVAPSFALLVFGIAAPVHTVMGPVLVPRYVAHVRKVVLVCFQVVQRHCGRRQRKFE